MITKKHFLFGGAILASILGGIGVHATLSYLGQDKSSKIIHATREKKGNAKVFFRDGKRIPQEPHLRAPGIGPDESLEKYLFPGKTTVIDHLQHVCETSPTKKVFFLRKVVKQHIERDCITGKDQLTYEHGPNVFVTFGEYYDMVESAAIGLSIWAPNTEMVGFLADTSIDWILMAHACQMNSVVPVTMSESEIVEIINECELSVVLCHVSSVKYLETCQLQCPTLKKLIIIGERPKLVNNKFLQTISVEELMCLGKDNDVETKLKKPNKNTLAIIMYTSGTTGKPKGVMLSHNNFTTAIYGFQECVRVRSDDVYISYLPFAHIFEQIMFHMFFFAKATIGFGNPRTLLKKPGGAKYVGDIENIKPTSMCGVPRIWESIRKAVEAKVRASGCIKQRLFNSIYSKKLEALRRRDENVTVALEEVVFKKVKGLFGGKLRLLLSGGAPLSEECQEFFTITLGVKSAVIQGYGLTETSAATTVQYPYFSYCGVGKVGFIHPSTEVKLADVPEMNYLTRDNPPQGEILVFSPTLSSGYYKNESKTKEVFVDGWFRTGDVGEICPDGQLKVIDRKKHLVKLSDGEYVSIESLECIYTASPFIQPNGICVVADPFHDYVVAIILIDQAFAVEWTRIKGGMTNPREIIKLVEFKNDLVDNLEAIAKKCKLKKRDRIKKFSLFIDVWSPENDTTTPSFKLKRRVIAKMYKKDIDRMYNRTDDKEDVIVEKEGYLYPSYFKVVQTYKH